VNENKVLEDNCNKSATNQDQDNNTEEYWAVDSGGDEEWEGGDVLEELNKQDISKFPINDNLTKI
jgi:hypothetical protein